MVDDMKILAPLVLLVSAFPSFAEEAILLRPAQKDVTISLQQNKEKPGAIELVIRNGSSLKLQYSLGSRGGNLSGYHFELRKGDKWIAESGHAWCGTGMIEEAIAPGESKALPIGDPGMDPVKKIPRDPGPFRVRVVLREEGEAVVATSPVYTIQDGKIESVAD